MRDIRVATVQFQHAAGDKAYNFGRILHFATEAARARVEMIAFPEMCLTGYWHVRKLSRAAFEALARAGPRRAVDAGPPGPVPGTRDEHRRGVAGAGARWRRLQRLCRRHAGWRVGGPPQAARLRASERVRREPLHRVRYAARLPRGRADLLRLQHRRERPRHSAAGRRDPARAAPDGRV